MSRLLKLLDSLRSIFGVLPILTILDVVKQLAKIGLPPDIAHENALRQWLTGLLPVLDTVADATPTDIDDHAAALVRLAVEDDQAWGALYGLLALVSSGRVAGDPGVADLLATKSGFDFETIMEIVRLILKLIDQLQ